MKLGIARWGLLAMVAGSLAGCLGGGGDGGGTTAPTTSTPTPTTPTVTSQPPTGGSTISVSSMSASTFADLTLDATNAKITGATVSSPPKIYFNLVDGSGNPIAGMTTSNLSFAIAKLVPGTNGSSSRWVSYMVINSAGTLGKPGTENTGTLTDNNNGSYVYTFANDITTTKARVDAASAGSNNKADLDDLTYDANLTHRVTIQLSGAKPGYGTDTSVTGVIKNPSNLIYDFVPATSTEVSQTETDGAKQRNIVDMRNCKTCHVKFTFHGRRNVAGTTGAFEPDIAAGIGGGRQDTRYCVVCHTDQRKYGVANSAATSTTVASGDRMSSSDILTGSSKDFSLKNLPVWIHKIHMGNRLVLNGYNANNIEFNEIGFPQDVRNCTKCHSDADGSTGGNTVPQADNWKSKPSRLVCGSCHDGIDFKSGTGYTVKQMRAARLSLTSAEYPYTPAKATAKLAAMTPTGHIGGAQSSDANCVLCHTADVVATQHVSATQSIVTNNTTAAGNRHAGNVNNLPAGAKVLTYDLASVTLNSSRNPVYKFKIKADGTDVVFNTPSATAEVMANFIGTTGLYVTFWVPQDGLTGGADWNAYVSTDIRGVLRGTASGGSAGTLAGPDGSGYYTITQTGSVIPSNATNLTGWMGLAYNPFAQTNVTGYTNLNVPAEAVSVLVSGSNVTGNVARRAIVEKDRCNSCHMRLGVFGLKTFHEGQRNNPQACAMCHRPNQSSSGWSSASISYIHGIHGGHKRTVTFNWHTGNLGDETGNPDAFAHLTYPGVLRECRQCHLPNTVNFGTGVTANTSNAKYAYENGKVPYYTVGQNKYVSVVGAPTSYTTASNCTATSGSQTAANAGAFSPYVTKSSSIVGGTDYGPGFGYNFSTTAGSISCTASGTVLPGLASQATREAAGSTLVNSPIVNACTGCHTTDPALAHMKANGGVWYTPRWQVAGAASAAAFDALPQNDAGRKLPYTEQCILCHGAGKVADAEVVHRQTMQ